jgi:hypothetical protein
MPKLVPDQFCPFCGHHFNRASNVVDDGLIPTEGDISICLECGEPGIYTADLHMRKPTPAEQIELATDEEYLMHRDLWRAWKQKQEAEHGR